MLQNCLISVKYLAILLLYFNTSCLLIFSILPVSFIEGLQTEYLPVLVIMSLVCLSICVNSYGIVRVGSSNIKHWCLLFFFFFSLLAFRFSTITDCAGVHINFSLLEASSGFSARIQSNTTSSDTFVQESRAISVACLSIATKIFLLTLLSHLSLD